MGADASDRDIVGIGIKGPSLDATLDIPRQRLTIVHGSSEALH